MIFQALETGLITYNDGKILFSVDYGRRASQTDEAPHGCALWSSADSDPIGDIIYVQQFMYDLYGVRMTRAITSRKVIMSIMNSSKFAARSRLIAQAYALP